MAGCHREAWARGEHGSLAAGATGLLDVNGRLYGTTSEGGIFGLGTVFSITLSGTEKVVYQFRGGRDGANPRTGLINVNGTLYGTTFLGGFEACGGMSECGTVFSFKPGVGEGVVYSFQGGSDGAKPAAHLLNVDGFLYGTTEYGGGGSTACNKATSGCGTVFSITP
jgi:uncharacterized repeat protein (TIGR03803 family)